MTPEQHLAILRTEGNRLGGLPLDALELPVPPCPGWSVDRLIGHTGRVHAWATSMLRSQATTDDEMRTLRHQLPQPPTGEAVLDFYREMLDALVAELDRSDPDEPCWTFVGPRTKRFWFRRQAQEISVHRWDADAAIEASGGPAPRTIAPDLAADGVDEFLGLFLPRFLPAPAPDEPERTLHLHGTDDPAPAENTEWFVRLTSDGPVVTTEHAKGDVALRGEAEDLLLVLWRRRPLDRLEVIGDASVAERLIDQTRVT